MKLRQPSQRIVDVINSHPTRNSFESTLSWPVPHMREDKLLLAFFLYLAAGPRGNRHIWYPHHRVFVDPESIEDLEFILVNPEEFGGPSVNKPFARQGGEHLGSMTLDEYDVLATQLYQLIDRILDFYLKPISAPSQSERETVVQYRMLFQKLTQPELWPLYRTVNPEFFNWIEEVDVGNG